jgi:hypothetical protein
MDNGKTGAKEQQGNCELKMQALSKIIQIHSKWIFFHINYVIKTTKGKAIKYLFKVPFLPAHQYGISVKCSPIPIRDISGCRIQIVSPGHRQNLSQRKTHSTSL